MNKLEGADFFTDALLCADPYPFFEDLRAKGPVYIEPHHGVAIVTGLDEALAVCNDPTESFSACSAASGPLPPLPFTPQGDDISAQIGQHRDQMPCADLLVTYDRPEHPLARGLLMHLFTPRRLKENEAYLYGLADRMATRCWHAAPPKWCPNSAAHTQPWSLPTCLASPRRIATPTVIV